MSHAYRKKSLITTVLQSVEGCVHFSRVSSVILFSWLRAKTFKFDSLRTCRPSKDLNQWHLDDPDMETEAEALNGEATDSRRMEVQIGGAVTLECDGGCWGHGPGMDPVGGPGPLALSRVVYQEGGEYRCVAPDRKMQDTWRAQLPYHITVTGESNKNSFTLVPTSFVAACLSFSRARYFFSHISTSVDFERTIFQSADAR